MRVWKWMVVGVLLGLAGCTDPDPDSPGDDDTAEEEVLTSATLGPDGGTLTLENGIQVVFPPGALESEVTLTIVDEETPELPYLDSGYSLVFSAFRIEPMMPMADGHPFEVRVPTEGLGSGEVELVMGLSGPGIYDSKSTDKEDVDDERLVHALVNPDEVTLTESVFEYAAVGGGIFQPLIAPTEDNRRSVGLTGTALGKQCSDAVAYYPELAAYVPVMDAVIDVSTPMARRLRSRHAALASDLAKQQAFEEAIRRFQARACVSLYDSRKYYATMGLPMPSRRMPLILEYEDKAITDGELKCTENLGSANGDGMSIYFNTDCEKDFMGFQSSTDSFPGLNLPANGGKNVHASPDNLEFTIAHELFHYVEDWTNQVPADSTWARNAVTEGGADWAADEVYDNVKGQPYNHAAMWETDLLDIEYRAHAWFKFLDWTQENKTPNHSDAFLVRLFNRIHRRVASGASPTEITAEDMDAVVAAMYPSRTDYGYRDSVADFAEAYLYTHDFERAIPDGAPGFDRFPDVNGLVADEKSNGGVWDDWELEVGGTYSPDIDTVVPDAVFMKFTPSTLKTTTSGSTTLEVGTAFLVELDLRAAATADDMRPRLQISATNSGGSLVETVQLGLYRPPSDGRASRVFRRQKLSVDSGNPTSVVLNKTLAQEKLVLIVSNRGSEETTVAIDVDGIEGKVAVLGRDSWNGGLAIFDYDESSHTQRLLGSGAQSVLPMESGARYAARAPLQNKLLVTSQNGFLSVFDLKDGEEVEIDWDNDVTTTDAGSVIEGMSRYPLEREPRGIASFHGIAASVVATQDGIEVINTAEMTSLHRYSNADLGIDDGAERAYEVAITPDDLTIFVSVRGRFSNVSTRILALDGLEVALGQSYLLRTNVEVCPSVNTGGMALSHDGEVLAVLCPDAQVMGVTRPGVAFIATDTFARLPLETEWGDGLIRGPLHFEPSGTPVWITWNHNDEEVYIGYAFGHGILSTNGVVRKCRLEDKDLGDVVLEGGVCQHEVAVDGAVRSLVAVGSGYEETVMVADDLGHVTRLETFLFSASKSTSGADAYNKLDGTGGCLAVSGGYDRATSCTNYDGELTWTDTVPTPNIGQFTGGMTAL